MKYAISILLALLLLVLVIGTFFLLAHPSEAQTPHLTLAVTGVHAADHHVSHITVKTLAKAALTISVLYLCSDRFATSKSLKGTVHADRNGFYTWTWTPDSKCKGNARATILANEYGQATAVQRVFSVV